MKHLLFPFMVFILITIFACQATDNTERIMTVNGLISSTEMGMTLAHEHVLVDWIGADSTGFHRWDRTDVVDRVLPYFAEIQDLGVNTFIDQSPAYLGRDPFVLEDISQRSGVQILTNTGYYGAVDNTFMPAHAWEESANDIAGRWIDEFENGIDGSELRPGFMKISVKEEEPLTELHQKIVKAATIVHRETGMTISSHTIGDQPAFDQIELLIDNGILPEAWIWTHAQSGSLEANIAVAHEGAWISYDGIRFDSSQNERENGSLQWYADRLLELKNEDLLHQVLISHDAGWYDAGEPNGGDFRSYTDIFKYFIPYLLEKGFTDEEIEQLLIHNPREAYTLRIRTID